MLRVPEVHFVFFQGQYKTLQERGCNVFCRTRKKDKVQFGDLWSEGVFFDQATKFQVMKN